MLARLPAGRVELRVRGRARGALHLDMDGFVVSVLAPGVPRLPNAVVAGTGGEPAGVVRWDPRSPPAWDPRPPAPRGGRRRVGELARMLRGLGPEPGLGIEDAAARLLGRGPGLTPEGDDVLAGAAAGVRALGPAAGLGPREADRLVAALVPADARARTTALAATLLELAAAGAAAEPVHRLVGGADPRRALEDLLRLGSTTGAAVAGGLGMAARHLSDRAGGGSVAMART